ncbi:hypothetical protein DM02DRAFT_667179 [Periconia macrospinosa]|uniref:Uncharacterized protein n=1 Tax=Periconia macrospinosa TaxID=97972 RepID=A0A2V1EBK3_9PLEO|nr:hypothetical protein DM02DRAFT_667179 [Periconia macrospinosa]
MAPVAQPPTLNGGNSLSNERFIAWLEKCGETEYDTYKNDCTTPAMSYEEWTKSDHVLGPYLMHVTMDILNETSSDEDEMSEVEAADVSRSQRVSTRPKNVTTNGYGMRQSAKSSKPTPRKNPDEAPGSAKRKRKSKKHSLSQEIVKSDESDVQEEAPANGRRKSGGRRKKQFLSEATIAPEDMDDDATSVDAGAVIPADSINSPAQEYGTPVVAMTTKSPQTKSAKKSKRKSLPQEILLQDSEDNSTTTRLATPNTTAASPNGPVSLSASRRGLRTRTAAQQNPYQHHAKLFEDQLSAEKSDESAAEPPPKKQTIKFVRSTRPIEDDKDETVVAEETDVLAEQSDDLLPNTGKAYYKGKGRAWRKTEEDEDEEFITKTKVKTPKQPKRVAGRRKSTQSVIHVQDEGEGEEAAQPSPEIVQNASPAVLSPSTKPPRKKPGPKPGSKRSQNSLGTIQKDQNGSLVLKAPPHSQGKTPKPKKEKVQESLVTTPGSSKKTGKQKSGPRKSQTLYLSEEFILNSSDTEMEEQPTEENGKELKIQRTPPKPAKPRGRPRKSDQSILSKDTVDSDDDADSVDPGENILPPVPPTSDNTDPILSSTAVVAEPLVEIETTKVDKELPPPVEIENQAPRLEDETMGN